MLVGERKRKTDVNRMKWVLSQDRFLEICRLAAETYPHVK
jgi:hypothetical protein